VPSQAACAAQSAVHGQPQVAVRGARVLGLYLVSALPVMVAASSTVRCSFTDVRMHSSMSDQPSGMCPWLPLQCCHHRCGLQMCRQPKHNLVEGEFVGTRSSRMVSTEHPCKHLETGSTAWQSTSDMRSQTGPSLTMACTCSLNQFGLSIVMSNACS
jgi:hypothetical protein